MLRYLQISALLCPACQRMLGEVSCNHQDAPSAFLGGRRWRTADALILSKRSLVRKLGRHSGSRGRGSRSAPLSVHTHTHTQIPYTQLSSYPAFSAIHRLLLEALPDFEVDLRGADSGGSFDVELVPVLADLHVGFGGGRHRHLPEHGVDT